MVWAVVSIVCLVISIVFAMARLKEIIAANQSGKKAAPWFASPIQMIFLFFFISGFLFLAMFLGNRSEKPRTDLDNLKTLIKLCVQDQYVSTTEFRWPEDSEWYIETTDVDGGAIYEVETYFGMPDASGKFLKHYLAATAYRDDNAKEWGVSSMAIDAQSVFG